LGDARRNASWNAVIALTFHFASSDTVAHRVADATGWVASAWPLGRESFFKELLVDTGQRVDDPEVRATLGGLPSSGKTGRLVRDVLALEAMNGRSNRAAALARALSSRVNRGERWMASRA
jgi:hypothetical protein